MATAVYPHEVRLLKGRPRKKSRASSTSRIRNQSPDETKFVYRALMSSGARIRPTGTHPYHGHVIIDAKRHEYELKPGPPGEYVMHTNLSRAPELVRAIKIGFENTLELGWGVLGYWQGNNQTSIWFLAPSTGKPRHMLLLIKGV